MVTSLAMRTLGGFESHKVHHHNKKPITMYTTATKITADSSIYVPVGTVEPGQVVMQTCHDGRMLLGTVSSIPASNQNHVTIIHETGLLINLNQHEPVLLIGDNIL